MPDYSIPLQVQQPNTLGNLASLVGTAQGLQNLQTQRLQQNILGSEGQTAQANAQLATQQMKERQLLQSSMQSGKDPDGNPLKGPDGEVDPVAMNAFASKYLPLTGQGVTQSIVQTLNNKVQLNNEVRGLNQNYRNDISGIIRSGIGTDGSEVGPALSAYAKANPDAAGAIQHAQSLLGTLSPQLSQGMRDNALLHLSQELQPAQETAQQQTPSVGTITGPGGGVQPIQTNPYAPGGVRALGGEFAQGINPAERTQVGINPLNGQPYTIVKPPTGVGASVGGVGGGATGGTAGGTGGGAATRSAPGNPAPGWPRLGMFPTPQQAQSASQAAQESDAIRTADSNPTTGYDATKQVYSNLMNIIKKDPAIGPMSKDWNKLVGVLTPSGSSHNMNMQEVSSYLDRLALQNASAAGLSTDAARKMAEGAGGSVEMSPQALAEKLRFGAATLEASHAYRQGLDSVVGTANQNPIAKRAFDAAWAQNADINVFRLQAAQRMDDEAGFKATLANIKKMPLAEQRMIQQHAMNLQLLAHGKMPQQ